MLEISGYSDCTVLHEDQPFSTIRAKKITSGDPVLIRANLENTKRLKDFAAIKKNHTVSGRLEAKQKLSSLEYLVENGSFFEVLEDTGYIPLSLFIGTSNVDKGNVLFYLGLMEKMANAVCDLHKSDLLHLGICTSSIFVHPESQEIKITGFSNSVYISENLAKAGTSILQNHFIQYISPEQTGKIDREIDFRSDIYSLGMLYFWLLTGRNAFEEKDYYDLVYCHIARMPPGVRELNGRIPEILSELVAKMIAKDSDDRYQSCQGLLYDLKRIITAKDSNSKFRLGEQDYSDQITLLDRVYGNEEVLKRFEDEIEKFNFTSLVNFHVIGEDGTGKSFIIEKLRGKCDNRGHMTYSHNCRETDRDIPLSTVAGLIDSFVDFLFTLPGELIVKWKEKISRAVSGGESLLVSISPKLERFIEYTDLGISANLKEEEERFNKALSNLLMVMYESEKGCVVFIEDIEFMDAASSRFLSGISNSPELYRFVLVTTSSHKDETNPDLVEGFQHFELENLSVKEVEVLLRDTLHSEQDSLNELAQIVRNKTGGVIKYIKSFLSTLKSEKLFKYDYDMLSWSWDIIGVMNLPEQGDVSDKVLRNSERLSNECWEIIKAASCIEREFSISMISALSGNDEISTVDFLSEAVYSGVLYVKSDEHESSENIIYDFTLSKIRSRIYYKMPENERRQAHLKIGSLLLDSVDHSSNPEKLFEIANHLDSGFSEISVASDNRKFLEIFYEAGIQAKTSLSYNLAFNYLSKAKNLITTSDWSADYDYIFRLLQVLVETTYLANERKSADKLFKESLGWARTDIDRASLYMTKTGIEVHLSDLKKSFESGLTGLEYLGISLPRSPGKLAVGVEILKSIILLRGKSLEDILNLPDVNDPKSIIAQNIYYLMLSYAQEIPELYSLIGLRMMQLSVKKGIHQHSFSGFTVYGSILTLGLGQIERGFRFMEFALKIAERSNSLSSIAGALFGLGMQGVYKKSLPECISYFRESHRLADLAGAKFYASTATNHLMIYSFIYGSRLDQLQEEINIHLSYAQEVNEKATILMLSAAATFVESLSIENFVESEKVLHSFERESKMIPILWTWNQVLKQAYFYFRGDFKTSLEYAERADEKISSTTFHLMYYYHILFRTLTYIQLFEKSSKADRSRIRKYFSKKEKILRKLAANSPDIFAPLYCLEKAALYKSAGETESALRELNSAIETCGSGYLWFRAIMLELSAEWNFNSDNRKRGITNLVESFDLFSQWGSGLKCNQLKQKYPHELSQVGASKMDFEFDTATSEVQDNLAAEMGGGIIESLKRLSAEVDLDKFMSVLISDGMRHAGAESGMVVSFKNANPVLNVYARFDNDELQIISDEPHLAEIRFPESIFNYVFRTNSPILSTNVLKDERFQQDSYVKEYSPRSILILPLASDSEVIGLLYFENRMTSGAFTEEKLQLSQILANQASISFQNARLFSQIMTLNETYQKFVPFQFIDLLDKKSIHDLSLGMGKNHEMTVLFCDIRRFTELSDKIGPEKTFSFLNDYLGIMEPVISEHGGFIDKYIGDAIMALFPAKSSDSAVKCGLSMIQKLEEFNEGRKEPIGMGIGINTGDLMLGILGSGNRLEGTVISDVVNVAARIEKLTKKFKVNMIVTGQTVDHLENPKEFLLEPLGDVQAEGRKASVEVYSVKSVT